MGGVSWSGTGWGSRSLEMEGSLLTLKMLFLDGPAAQKNAFIFKSLMHCRRPKNLHFAFMKAICKGIFAPQARPKNCTI